MRIDNIREAVADICDNLADVIRPKRVMSINNRNSESESQNSSKTKLSSKKNQKELTEEELIKNLKVLMSIPINSYSNNNLDEFLDELWSENVIDTQKRTLNNYYNSKRGMLVSLKEYAQKKDRASIIKSIDYIKSRL